MTTVATAVTKGGWAYWLDCPTHGSMTLAQAPIGVTAWCPLCAKDAPMAWRGTPGTSTHYRVFDPPLPNLKIRAIKVGQQARRGDGHQCDGRCLSGKRSCSCKCMGRCHGQGSCSCGMEG